MHRRPPSVRDRQHIPLTLCRHYKVFEVNLVPNISGGRVVRYPACDVRILSRSGRKLVEADSNEASKDPAQPDLIDKCYMTRPLGLATIGSQSRRTRTFLGVDGSVFVVVIVVLTVSGGGTSPR